MNKIIFSFSFIVLIFTLHAQMGDNDYNPWKYIREELIISSLEKMQLNDRQDCESVKEAIDNYNVLRKETMEKDTMSFVTYMSLRSISFFQCPSSYNFIKDLIKTDSSEQIKCGAIRLLGWMRGIESITFLKELLKKERLSTQEKYHIILAFCQIGIFNEREDIMDEAIELTEQFCSSRNGMAYNCASNDCAELYFTIGGEPATNYFSYCLENEKYNLVAALKLAQLGEYEKTFPIFAETIKNKNVDDMFTAMQGLAAIGTEEAFKLIRAQTQNENASIAKQAQWIFDYIDRKRREQ